MKIKDVLFAPGKSSFFFDDQRAIKNGATHNGFIYEGNPVTEGFKKIRKSGESISIILILENQEIAIGDCAAVQYSGAGGRDPLFLAKNYLPILEKKIKPLLMDMEIANFRKMTDKFEKLQINGKQLHTAIRYGISQALLNARAIEQKKIMSEIISEEYNLPITAEPVPIFGQSGDSRYEHVDKMILKQVDVLPHGLINNIDEKLGRKGELLQEYIEWLVKRIAELKPNENYHPSLHIDVYGTIGTIFDYNMQRVADYLASLEKFAGKHELYIEGPVDMEEKHKEIDALYSIKKKLTTIGSKVKIVADEWCNTLKDIRDFTDADACHMVQIKTPDLGGIQNTVDSVIYCKQKGMEAYQGGTCNETDISAKACVHIAMASRPKRILAKPGMGFDEGFSITNNEMSRIIAILKAKKN